MGIPCLRCQHYTKPVADAYILTPHPVEDGQHLDVETGFRDAGIGGLTREVCKLAAAVWSGLADTGPILTVDSSDSD